MDFHLGQIRTMNEDVVHGLQVEALLDFGEGRVEEVGQCHKVHEQAHCDDYVVRLQTTMNLNS